MWKSCTPAGQDGEDPATDLIAHENPVQVKHLDDVVFKRFQHINMVMSYTFGWTGTFNKNKVNCPERIEGRDTSG